MNSLFNSYHTHTCVMNKQLVKEHPAYWLCLQCQWQQHPATGWPWWNPRSSVSVTATPCNRMALVIPRVSVSDSNTLQQDDPGDTQGLLCQWQQHPATGWPWWYPESVSVTATPCNRMTLVIPRVSVSDSNTLQQDDPGDTQSQCQWQQHPATGWPWWYPESVSVTATPCNRMTLVIPRVSVSDSNTLQQDDPGDTQSQCQWQQHPATGWPWWYPGSSVSVTATPCNRMTLVIPRVFCVSDSNTLQQDDPGDTQSQCQWQQHPATGWPWWYPGSSVSVTATSCNRMTLVIPRVFCVSDSNTLQQDDPGDTQGLLCQWQQHPATGWPWWYPESVSVTATPCNRMTLVIPRVSVSDSNTLQQDDPGDTQSQCQWQQHPATGWPWWYPGSSVSATATPCNRMTLVIPRVSVSDSNTLQQDDPGDTQSQCQWQQHPATGWPWWYPGSSVSSCFSGRNYFNQHLHRKLAIHVLQSTYIYGYFLTLACVCVCVCVCLCAPRMTWTCKCVTKKACSPINCAMDHIVWCKPHTCAHKHTQTHTHTHTHAHTHVWVLRLEAYKRYTILCYLQWLLHREMGMSFPGRQAQLWQHQRNIHIQFQIIGDQLFSSTVGFFKISFFHLNFLFTSFFVSLIIYFFLSFFSLFVYIFIWFIILNFVFIFYGIKLTLS